MIYPVILCGGKGGRLWPLSLPDLPKQFLKLNGDKTLFQQTILRIKDINFLEEPIIITNIDYRFIVAEQLREIGLEKLKIIVEPEIKNTAASVNVAVLEVYKINPCAQILVLPSDHYIEDIVKFAEDIESAMYNHDHIKLFGIKPTYAETGYGYIEEGERITDNLFKINIFIEKPNLHQAEMILEKGKYYWNSGIFLIPIRLFLKEMEKYNPEILYYSRLSLEKSKKETDFIYLDKSDFSKLDNISLDYALIEKTDKLLFIKSNFIWNDLGNWKSIWKISNKDENGNNLTGNIIAIESTNNYILSKKDRLLVTVGINNLAIIETEDALLVTSLKEGNKIKDLSSFWAKKAK